MRRVLLSVLVIMLGVPAGASTAATAQSLTLTSVGTAEVTLTVTRSLTFDPSQMRVLRGGKLAGVGVPDLLLVEVKVRAWTSAFGGPRVATSSDPVTLKPGRYRVVVYGDGPTTVQIPLQKGSSLKVNATRGTSATAKVDDLGGPVVAANLRRTVRYPGAVLLSQVFFRARAHQVDVTSQCFVATTERAQHCVNQYGGNYALLSPGSVGDGYTSAFVAAYENDFPKADIDVLLQGVDVDVPTTAQWLVATL